MSLLDKYRQYCMSLNRKKELTEVTKVLCRELRKNSTKAETIFWEAVRNKKCYRPIIINTSKNINVAKIAPEK